MSQNKSLKFRAALTLSTTMLLLCAVGGTGFAAGAAHEGRIVGMRAGARGGGDLGEARSLNARLDSMRVETLSPAGFVSRSPMTGNVQPATPTRFPATDAHPLVRDPIVLPDKARGNVQPPTRANLQPTEGQRLIQDPVVLPDKARGNVQPPPA